jgi:hypothetical protein
MSKHNGFIYRHFPFQIQRKANHNLFGWKNDSEQNDDIQLIQMKAEHFLHKFILKPCKTIGIYFAALYIEKIKTAHYYKTINDMKSFSLTPRNLLLKLQKKKDIVLTLSGHIRSPPTGC